MRTDELWCNGSTTDSDSVCLGSNPGRDSDSVCLGSNPGSSTKVPLLRGTFFVRWVALGNTSRCRRMCGNVAGAREIWNNCVFLREK